MMKKLLLTSVAAMAGAAGSAAAADLPARLPVKALPPVQHFSWTGCYLGAHAGKGWGDTKNLTSDVTADTKGWLAGGQIGCDYQFAPNLVFGVEGMAAWTDIHGKSDPFFSNKNVFSTQTNWIASATARLGFSADRWLIYLKGGPAWSNDDYRVRGSFLGTPFDDRGRSTKSGWTWGVGFEWAFAPNWSTKLEYNQYDFNRSSVRLDDRLSSFSTTSKFEHEIRTVTLGINYRFATGRP